MREIVEFFHTLTLFRGLSTSELEDIARMVQPFVRDPGETLFRQGADSDGIYFIQYGLVEICARVPGDEILTLARLEKGSVFGEVGLLDCNRRTATALAVVPTNGYLLGRRHFELLRLDHKPASLSIMQRLIENTCDAVRRSYARIGELLQEVAPLSRETSETCSALSRADADGIPFGSLPFFSQLSTQELKACSGVRTLAGGEARYSAIWPGRTVARNLHRRSRGAPHHTAARPHPLSDCRPCARLVRWGSRCARWRPQCDQL